MVYTEKGDFVMKRVLCLLLSVCFVVIMCIATPVSVSAKTYTFDKQHVIGDVDGDGILSVVDVTCVQRMLVGMDMPVGGLNDCYYFYAADADGDGTVTAIDATIMLRHCAWIPTSVDMDRRITITANDVKMFNAYKCYAFMQNQGFDDVHIAGLLGYFDALSGIDSTYIQNDYIPTFGLSDEHYCFGQNKTDLFYIDGKTKVLNAYDLDDYCRAVSSDGILFDTSDAYVYNGEDGNLHYMPCIGLFGVSGENAMSLIDYSRAVREKRSAYDWHDIDVQLAWAFSSSDNTGSYMGDVMSVYKNKSFANTDEAVSFINSRIVSFTPRFANSVRSCASKWQNVFQTWSFDDFGSVFFDYVGRISKLMQIKVFVSDSDVSLKPQ